MAAVRRVGEVEAAEGYFCVSRSLCLGSVYSCSTGFLLWIQPSGERVPAGAVGFGGLPLSLALWIHGEEPANGLSACRYLLSFPFSVLFLPLPLVLLLVILSFAAVGTWAAYDGAEVTQSGANAASVVSRAHQECSETTSRRGMKQSVINPKLAIFLKDKVVQGLSDKISSYCTSPHFIIRSPDGCDYSQSGKSILMKMIFLSCTRYEFPL